MKKKTRNNLSFIDLRSDTVTQPSSAMRRAIADAEVGDDVLDGDPTTKDLESRVAELLGQEAALFFPSGTQANQVAVGLHVRPGDELIVDDLAHLLHLEQGGASATWGAQVRTIPGVNGRVDAIALEPLMRSSARLRPGTGMVSLENSHNASGGRVTPVETVAAVAELVHSHNAAFHLDGARLWNAAVAAGVEPIAYGTLADTVMVSFSKGLGCPAGSCLAGSKALLQRGAALRQRLGGGMRQSGILAAACIYALEHNRERLVEDHRHARELAAGLRDVPGIAVTSPETNIVMIDLQRETATEAAKRLRAAGVLLSVFGPRRLRAVTHLDVTINDVQRAAEVIGTVLSSRAA